MSADAPRPAKAPDEKVAKSALKAFLSMDTDNDGSLSLEEFRSGLGTLGLDLEFVHILFNSFDKDGSGSIEKKEFLAAMAVMLHPDDTDEQIGMVFDSYDKNKDGKLQMDELQHVISAIFATMQKMGIQEENADPVKTCSELYHAMDRDNKGFVTKEDYIRLATVNPEMLKKIGLGGSRMAPRSISRMRSATNSSSAGILYGVPQRHGDDTPRSRKHGTTVSFGHDNWELVVQMMLAIRLSVGRSRHLSLEHERKTSAEALAAKPVVPQGEVPTAVRQSPGPLRSKKADLALSGAPSGEKPSQQPSASLQPSAAHYDDVWKTTIPGHAKGDAAPIAFKDYAPLVFRCIRQLFGVSDADYMLSLGPEQILGELLLGTMGSLSELFSEGKVCASRLVRGLLPRAPSGLSQAEADPLACVAAWQSGSFFYFSNDGRYLIKTIPHRELFSLLKLLPQYYAHVQQQPHTLLPRFMGAHRLILPHQRKKVHFVVMTNVFSTARVIHHRYDLKGSTHGRSAGASVLAEYPDVVRKDLDLEGPFCLRPEARDSLLSQIRTDVNFLRAVYTMDYSLLCGIHFPQREPDQDFGQVHVQILEDGRSHQSPSASAASASSASPARAASGSCSPTNGAGPSSKMLAESSNVFNAGRARLPARGSGLPPWVDFPDGAIEAQAGSAATETEPVNDSARTA